MDIPASDVLNTTHAGLFSRKHSIDFVFQPSLDLLQLLDWHFIVCVMVVMKGVQVLA